MNENLEQNFDFSNESVNSAQQDKNEESVNQKINKKDVSREARIRAEKAILESLDLDSDASLDNFQEKLRTVIESIPQYQELEQKLADVPPEKLPYELFKMFQRSADSPDSYNQEKALHEDGVLVKQIKQGSPLMCAGRVMIASTFLQKHGIEHSVISTVEGDEDDASGHSAMLLRVGEDKLAYFDAQNNLYFTFPKSALRGYVGTEKTSECVLGEYIPDENDVIDGLNSINIRFVASPPNEGISRQYFNNIKSALSGKPQFTYSGIAPDSEVIDAVDQIEREFFGENSILEKREQHMEELINQYKDLIKENKDTTLLSLESFPEKEDFIVAFSSILHDSHKMAEIYPYLKNASVGVRRKAAEKIWDHLQKIENPPEENSAKSENEKSENIENETAAKHKLIEILEKAGTESRFIKIENNGEFSEMIILNKKEVSTEKLVRIYRGINHLDDNVLKQTPYAMRSIDESGNFKILENVRQEVDTLVNNPTYENLLAYVNKVRASLGPKEAQRLDEDLLEIENGILDGVSTRRSLIFEQIKHHGGVADSGIAPYISASFDPSEAAGYGRNGLIVIDVPISEIEYFSDNSDGGEINIKGLLDKKYITAIIPREAGKARDKEEKNKQLYSALQKVYESVSVPLYNEQEMHIAREKKISDEKKYDEEQWRKDVAMVRQKRAEKLISEFPETNIDFQTAQQESVEQNTDVYKKIKNYIFDKYKNRLEKVGRNRKIDDYEFESRYGWEKFDSEKINDIMLVKLRELVLRLEQREKKNK